MAGLTASFATIKIGTRLLLGFGVVLAFMAAVAVVANEVRNLAQRSASAAKEIKTMIADSVEKVGLGTELANEAGATMCKVVASVQSVTGIMGEISRATAEQSVGLEQVNHAIGEIDSLTQQNSALVVEAATARWSWKRPQPRSSCVTRQRR